MPNKTIDITLKGKKVFVNSASIGTDQAKQTEVADQLQKIVDTMRSGSPTETYGNEVVYKVDSNIADFINQQTK